MSYPTQFTLSFRAYYHKCQPYISQTNFSSSLASKIAFYLVILSIFGRSYRGSSNSMSHAVITRSRRVLAASLRHLATAFSDTFATWRLRSFFNVNRDVAEYALEILSRLYWPECTGICTVYGLPYCGDGHMYPKRVKVLN